MQPMATAAPPDKMPAAARAAIIESSIITPVFSTRVASAEDKNTWLLGYSGTFFV